MVAEEYEQRKAELPDLTFACAEPITKFETRVFPDLERYLSDHSPTEAHDVTSSVDGSEFAAGDPIYFALIKDLSSTNAEKAQVIYASEDQIHSDELQAWDFSSIVWYRLGRPYARLA